MKSKKVQMGYSTLAEHPQRVRRNETNDCSVMALALGCGVSYAKAHEAMKKQGRKNRDGAWGWQVEYAARTIGYELVRVKTPAKTVAKLPYELTQAGMYGRFLVKTTTHFLAIVDGKVEDWSGGRTLRIEAVYRVEKLTR